jgi:hypothetical protein
MFLIFVPIIFNIFYVFLIYKELNILSFLLGLACIFLFIILWIILNLLNKYSKNKIVFTQDKIYYKGKSEYKENMSFRYFKFHIYIIETDFVFPKLHINGDNISLTCYLSKKDINKLEHMGYEIIKV